MDDGSCIVLGGETCGGHGLCVGNGTCVCLHGYSQTLEFHYLGAWDSAESAPCSGREAVHISLVLMLAIYSFGLAFQLFITRTLPQLLRAAPTIVGYLLVISPTAVRLSQWGSADMGVLTSVGYSSCLGIAVGAFVGGIGVFLSKYVSFIVKSSKRANFNMTPDTIRKIKLGNMMIYFITLAVFVSMQAWAAGSVVGDRATRGVLAKAGWIGLGLCVGWLGLTADYLFSVVQKSFSAFLETAKRMSSLNVSLKSLPSPGSVSAGNGEVAASAGATGRGSKRRSSSIMFSFRRIAPVANGPIGNDPKNETVKRIEAQLTVVRKFRRVIQTGVPVLGLTFVVVGSSDYLVYKYGILCLNIALILLGILIVGGTVAMYNLGTRKRANNAARQSRLSRTSSAGAQSAAAASSIAPSTVSAPIAAAPSAPVTNAANSPSAGAPGPISEGTA
jgi:hypothetical protein